MSGRPAFFVPGLVFAYGVVALVAGYFIGLDRGQTKAFVEATPVPTPDAGAHCWTPPGDAPVFASRVMSTAVTRRENDKEVRLYLWKADDGQDEHVDCDVRVPADHPYAHAFEHAEPTMPVLIMLSMPEKESDWR